MTGWPAPWATTGGGSMIYQGDVLDWLPLLPESSIDQVVTSPPYFGLRQYGDSDLEHGSEADVQAWVDQQVEVCRMLRRVLRPWGTLFVNVADKRPGKGGRSAGRGYRGKPAKDQRVNARHLCAAIPAIKAGELCGAPWRLALALQADGWWLLSDVIWAPPDPAPETLFGVAWERCRRKVGGGWGDKHPGKHPGSMKSRSGAFGSSGGSVPPETAAQWEDCPGCSKCRETDKYVLRQGRWRPTAAHQHLFMFAAGPRHYWDQVGSLEPTTGGTKPGRRSSRKSVPGNGGSIRNNAGWAAATSSYVLEMRNGRDVQTWLKGQLSAADYGLDVDHFASYPEALPAWCIRGGTSERGNCPACGRPWARIVEKRYTGRDVVQTGDGVRHHGGSGATGAMTFVSLGWRPTCTCDAGEPVPAVILDPYSGAGTTLLAAERLGRRGVGVELYEDYCRLAERRIEVELRPHGEHVEGVAREMPAITGPLFE